MPSTLFNVTSGAITWDKEETEVTQDEVAFVDIKAVGWTDSTNQALDTALLLTPLIMPITAAGPVGIATKLANAEIQRVGIRYAEGMFRIEATYKAFVGDVTEGPGGGSDEQVAAQDKVGKRIQTTEEPLLTHPLVQTKFPKEQFNMLSALISGYIRPASDVSQETGGSPIGEFVRQDVDTGAWDNIVTFSDEQYSVTMNNDVVISSPLTYARIIKSGVTTWKCPGTVLTWSAVRKARTSAGEINSIGSVVSPPIADNVDGRDWFFDGLNETQVTDSIFQIEREYTLSGPGGAIGDIYAGGSGEIASIP